LRDLVRIQNKDPAPVGLVVPAGLQLPRRIWRISFDIPTTEPPPGSMRCWTSTASCRRFSSIAVCWASASERPAWGVMAMTAALPVESSTTLQPARAAHGKLVGLAPLGHR